MRFIGYVGQESKPNQRTNPTQPTQSNSVQSNQPSIWQNDFRCRCQCAAFKTTSRERRKTASLFTRVEARTERTAQRRRLRLSLRHLKHVHSNPRSCCF